MEIYTKTKTASTPAFGLPMSGHPRAAVRALGAGVVAAFAGVAVIARPTGDFWGPPAWSPPTS